MDLSPEDQDRIIAEEKVRMETRRAVVHDWKRGHGGHLLVKGLAAVAVIAAIRHLSHRHC